MVSPGIYALEGNDTLSIDFEGISIGIKRYIAFNVYCINCIIVLLYVDIMDTGQASGPFNLVLSFFLVWEVATSLAKNRLDTAFTSEQNIQLSILSFSPFTIHLKKDILSYCLSCFLLSSLLQPDTRSIMTIHSLC